MNTDAKKIVQASMNHTEGGWPEHVRTELVEHKNKFIRQTCKEDMFKVICILISTCKLYML